MTHKIKIFNTLTNKKDLFSPIKGKVVNMFVSGPTVYDYSHIGNARINIIFDTFARYLKFVGYTVNYVQNITDIDDKIIARAREKGVSPKDLAVAFEKEYLEEMKLLNIHSVTKYARATSYMKEIVGQINKLLKKAYAYKIEGDGIYFNVNKFRKFGKLSGRLSLQSEDAVTRIDYSKNKKNRADFCLWKFRQDSSEPGWTSPLGDGRPGWHIEDTAIIEKFFGAQFDIHGGGKDLMFPHHEAEISQMEAISGKSPMARYWMHSGFLNVGGEKMAKSTGNVITVSDFRKRCPANCMKFLMMRHHYRSSVDYTESMLIEVKGLVGNIEDFLRKIISVKTLKPSKSADILIKKFSEAFYKHLDDDFNTPLAFSVMFQFMTDVTILLEKDALSKKQASEIYKLFEDINTIFGILDLKKINEKIPTEILKLSNARLICKIKKEWDKADEMQLEIEKRGFIVEDTKDGPALKRVA